jgi:hypothetical protein
VESVLTELKSPEKSSTPRNHKQHSPSADTVKSPGGNSYIEAIRRANSMRFLEKRPSTDNLHCGYCKAAILAEDFGVILNFLWYHAHCLSCTKCGSQLSDRDVSSHAQQGSGSPVIIKDDKPYCPVCADEMEAPKSLSPEKPALQPVNETPKAVTLTTNSSVDQTESQNLLQKSGSSQDTPSGRMRSDSVSFFPPCESCSKLITSKVRGMVEGI